MCFDHLALFLGTVGFTVLQVFPQEMSIGRQWAGMLEDWDNNVSVLSYLSTINN